MVDLIVSPTYQVTKYLAGLLTPYLGKTEGYVKNSISLVQTLDSVTLSHNDIMVNQDVVSLFTNMPPDVTLEMLRLLFPPPVMEIFCCVLRSAKLFSL